MTIRRIRRGTILWLFVVLHTHFNWGNSLDAQDGEGSATIGFGDTEGSHIQVPVDTRGTFVLRYRAGPSGIAVGGGIDVLRRGQWDFRFGAVLQTADPLGEGYVTARTRRANVQLSFTRVSDYFKRQHVLRLRVEGQPLVEGDEIELRFGDTSAGGPGTLTHAVAHKGRTVFLSTDGDGDGIFQRLKQPVYVDLVPGPTHHISVVAPSEAAVGDRIEILVRAEDINSNLQPNHEDGIELSCRGGEDFSFFDEMRDGFHPVTKIYLDGKGYARVVARGERQGIFWLEARTKNDLSARSNPIRVIRGKPGSRLWWGDLHVHTFLSDGTNTLAANYEFARDVAGVDFVALTDHLHPRPEKRETMLDSALVFALRRDLERPLTLSAWWNEQVEVAARFDAPGRFATLFAYEWSGASKIGGDHNVYFGGPFVAGGATLKNFPLLAPQDLDRLYDSLAEGDRGDVVVIPHVGGRIGNWDFHRADVETALEICSVHGHFEWFAQEALQRGYRTAFVGAGDNHHGRPGYAVWQRFGRLGFKPRAFGVPNGLAAVRARRLDRQEIVHGLRRRRSYATTGVRILVSFAINGRPMGASLTTAEPPRVSFEVNGTAPVERVDVIRDQFRIARFEGGDWSFKKSMTDTTVGPGWHYYYLRIMQTDGELAWASPIWVSYTGETAEEKKHPAWNDDGKIDDWRGDREPIDAAVTGRLKEHLEASAPERFTQLVGIRRIENPRGSYYIFFARDEKSQALVHMRYYDEFSAPRLHIYPGWGDYGPIRR